MDQVFVVGTGRCGSTLLSAMLKGHPEVTSISEFFSFVTDLGGRAGATFEGESVDGEEIWRRVATAWPRQNLMLRHDVAMPEVLYPWRGGHRFDATSGVPAIGQVVLPHITDDFDTLYDSLGAYVRTLPPAPVGRQFRALFEWLCAYEGTTCWAERSGGGLRILRRLQKHFPDARYVHIVRDGRDTAISMSNHLGFRMVLVAFQLMESLGVDPFESNDRTWEEDLPDDLARLLPERFSREAFLDYQAAPPLCGHYWSGEIIEGLAVLDELPSEQLITLRYEDFLTSPQESARSLAAFLRHGRVDEEWVERSASLVGRGRSNWQQLDPKTKRQLEDACRPGFEALASRGFHWP